MVDPSVVSSAGESALLRRLIHSRGTGYIPYDREGSDRVSETLKSGEFRGSAVLGGSVFGQPDFIMRISAAVRPISDFFQSSGDGRGAEFDFWNRPFRCSMGAPRSRERIVVLYIHTLYLYSACEAPTTLPWVPSVPPECRQK